MSAAMPEEIKPCLQGVIPSVVVTCSADGVPNVTYISQVYWVDGERVALSFQFFNKTVRNVRQNPHARATVADPVTAALWEMDLYFDHSETDGPVFDAMDMQIEAIASMTGMAGVFKLKAADIYRVRGVRRIETT
jgi:uncharacterized protein